MDAGTGTRAGARRRAVLKGAALALVLPTVPPASIGTAAARVPGTLRIGGAGSGLKATWLVADAFESARADAEVAIVPYLGSSGGIKALTAGVIDVALVGRALKDEERTLGLIAHEYARSPFVFVTRLDTAVEGMTLDAVAAAFAGRIDAWPDGSPLRLILQAPGTPDMALLRGASRTLARALEEAYARPGLLVIGDDQEYLQTLEQVPGSLGAITLGQIIAERRRLKPLALDGVAPTTAALALGAYRFEKILHLVVRAEPEPLAREFTAFTSSPEAQAILTACGFLPPGAAG